MSYRFLALLFVTFFYVALRPSIAQDQVPHETDVVVYGGTSAAVIAAVAADRLGQRVSLVSPDRHLGGMTSSGLGWTDSKNGNTIGGLAREFYHRVWLHYNRPEAWTASKRDEYNARVHAQPGKTIDDGKQVMWTFEPHIAEQVFEDILADSKVSVDRDEWLDRESGVRVNDGRITEIRMLSGKLYRAKVFIDATYEGDLMASAGVSYRIGRDAAKEYDEPLNGIYFKKPDPAKPRRDPYEGISPFRVPGDPSSGYISGVEGPLPANEKEGDADGRIQSFNFRMCLTVRPENRVPITKPENYDESQYELLLRLNEKGVPGGFSTQEMPNAKTDSNNYGPMSLDYVGGNSAANNTWNYSEVSYEKRREIIRDHINYTRGLLWTLMNHPRIAEKNRLRQSRFGLAADEFRDNGNWPYQIYIREARRMQGQFVMTQHHVEMKPGYEITDSIGLGCYSLDSHPVRRLEIDGRIVGEGSFYVKWHAPYPIAYGTILPKRKEVQNLLVPLTLSATHAAFGSIRMEPTYMILGQSAGAAAVLAIEGKKAVQDISYELLKKRLLDAGQVLFPAQKGN